MDEIVPWDESIGIIAPYYPQEKQGRNYCYAMRKCTGINFMAENVPDETALYTFRHLLEKSE